MTLAHKLEKADWAGRIEALREKLKLSQGQMAQRLGVTQTAVSHWEKGRNEPNGEVYVRIARLAEGHDRAYFLGRAGVSSEDLERVVDVHARRWRSPEVTVNVLPAKGAASQQGGTRLKTKPDVVAVPLLKDAAAAGSPRLIEESAVDDVLFVAPTRAPHPDSTFALRVAGNSMEPSLRDGFIVVIDTKEREPRDLVNDMVVARDPGGAITVKYLRSVHDEYLLVAEHTSVQYDPVLLSKEPGWKILGKVLWWIGQPQPK